MMRRHGTWQSLLVPGLLVLGVTLGAAQGVAHNAAVRVVSYTAGAAVGKALDPAAALGEPARVTLDPVWGAFPVDPFSPAYLTNQVVTLGDGGSLTLEFERPVLDDPAHRHGGDFIVFGNAFLQLGSDFTTATGALGGAGEGATRVLVSLDGATYYELAPGRAVAPDAWYPTDGAGDFSVPMDPSLAAGAFAGQDLAGVRSLYGGSGGGTAYDLAWAVDARGSNVVLQAIRYVRFEQAGGSMQLDAVCAAGQPVAWEQRFDSDPAGQGWGAWGDATLFSWNRTNHWLDATWDSGRTNSYFWCPLGTVLSREDDFALVFDMRLDAVTPGVDPEKPGSFQLALGLLSRDEAVRTNLARGAGMNDAGPRSVLEFDYFPDAGFGATLSPTVISRSNEFASQFVYPVELPIGRWVKVGLYFSGGEGVLRTRVTEGVSGLAVMKDVQLLGSAGSFDFRLDAVAVCSYSDWGQDPMFGGSLWARGAVDNVMVVVPPRPVERLEVRALSEATGVGVTVRPQPGWTYRLMRSMDLVTWTEVATAIPDSIAAMELRDPAAPGSHACYRVVAEKP